MKITLCIPTRHRQSRILECVDNISSTIKSPENVQIALYIDDDDNITNEIKIQKMYRHLNFYICRRRRVDGSKRYNVLAMKTKSEILGYFADDVLFQTDHWDEKLIEIYEQSQDKILLVGCADYASANPLAKKATHGFLSREAVNVVGYFFPPNYLEYWHDQWLTEVYKGIDRFYMSPDIKIKHNSYRVNPELFDGIYMRMNHKMKDGRTIIKAMRDFYYTEEQAQERQNWITKLKGYIENFKNIQ